MKAFSPAGMAVKAYYGHGARTFGNPDGAFSGGGAYARGGNNPNGPNQGGGGAPSLWNPVYVDPNVTDDYISDLVVTGATNIVALTNASNFVYSNDSGVTWTYVANPFPNSTENIAAGGGVICAFGRDGFSQAVVGRSTDGGATWSAVSMPGGFAAGGIAPVVYAAGTFVIFDQSVARLWKSADGLTWSAHAITRIFFPGNWQRIYDGFVVGPGNRAVWAGNDQTINGLTVTTNDGVTFTETTQPAARRLYSVSFDGTVYNAIGPQGGGPIYGLTSTDGSTWSLANTTGPPPYQALQTGLSGVGILNAPGGGLTLAKSTDHGVTYTDIALTTALTSIYELANDGARAYITGDGIIATADLTSFTDELVVPGGLVRSVVAGFNLTFGFGGNGTSALIWKRP